jgi:putative restriction endonuclease
MFDRTHDTRVRTAAFEWLSEQVSRRGDVLPRDILANGFLLDSVRVPLVGPQGIFKPKILQEVPLSITTAPERPYPDAFGPDGLLRYRYRGSDRNHTDNQGLRRAMERRLPLIYFHGVVTGKYVAAWPVYVVGDDPASLAFSVAVDDPKQLSLGKEQPGNPPPLPNDAETVRRSYITSQMRVRVHQQAFRERVLEAYRRQCAFCRLRHDELLEAAHIIPDKEPEGEPVVRNGVALCSLHHAAFDRYFLGLRPDYVIEVRADLLREHDGPTLIHAIQALHGSRMILPMVAALRPDPALLERRYELFRQSI